MFQESQRVCFLLLAAGIDRTRAYNPRELNYSNGESNTAGAAIGLAILVLLLFAISCCACAVDLANNEKKNEKFEAALIAARSARRTEGRPRAAGEPTTGVYKTQYKLRGAKGILYEFNEEIMLRFVRNASGWTLKGEGHGGSGGCDNQSFTVTEGAVSNNGTAHWTQGGNSNSGPPYLLSTGRFDFVQNTFTGNVLTRTGGDVKYDKFVLARPGSANAV